MAFPDDIPTSKMSPPQFSSLKNNDFKREGTSHSNALICPPPRMTLPQSNRSDHIFYKTRICTKFRFGACRNGTNCDFAHGAEEIRKPPPNSQKLVGLCNEDKKIINKMKLSKKYSNGEECPYADKCKFLHEDPAQFRGTYRKTKLCLKWKDTGYCSFGKNCHFAHGEEELQVPGGAIEAEAAITIENSTNPTTSPASQLVEKEEEQPKKKRILGLKFSQINRIYGDWIDD